MSAPQAEKAVSVPHPQEQRKKILYFNGGGSPYDDFFISDLTKDFGLAYATLNPHPTIKLPYSKPIVLRHPLAFLYRWKSTRGLIQFTSVRPVRSLIEKVKPDAIIGCYATNYGYLCAKSDFSPNILFVFGSDVLLDPKNPILGSYVKTALKRADLIVLDSKVQEDAAVRLGADGSKVLLIPWVDAEALAAMKPSSISLREKQKWRDDDIVIFSARNHERLYQVDKVIMAFDEVHKRISNTKLVVAGAGSQSEKLRRLVSSQGLDSVVYFTGYLPREVLISVYDESNLYVSASLSDGTSASLIEAMSRRVPAVVSDIEGNREWVEDGKNGFLFDLHSPNQLVDTMLKALRMSPEASERLTDAAYQTVIDRATWRKNRVQLIDAINSLIEQ